MRRGNALKHQQVARWFTVRYALKAARLQSPVLTNRKGIWGYKARISKHIIAKSQLQKTFHSRYHRHRMKEEALTGGGLGSYVIANPRSQQKPY
jgi:hypothetical protein